MNKSIIVSAGGLGNQLFQYAFFLNKKKHNPHVILYFFVPKKETAHNAYELGKLFGILPGDYSLGANIVRKLLIFRDKKGFRLICRILLAVMNWPFKVIQEQDMCVYREEYLKPAKGRCLYFGYWQSYRYLEPIEEELRAIYRFEYFRLSDKSRKLLSKLRSEESVAIHIRRGDFLSEENKNKYGNLSETDYYTQAIARMKERLSNPCFYVFSDDQEWAKNNLALEQVVYVDWNKGRSSWEDMCLMSECKHNIIANSTFSWWGAWLNKHKQKIVIAPDNYLKDASTPDIYPPDWLIINT